MAGRVTFRWGWMLFLLAVVLFWNVINDDDQPRSPLPPSANIQRAPATTAPNGSGAPVQQIGNPAPLYVTVDTLNVRAAPSTSSAVLVKVSRGTEIDPTHRSGPWIGIALSDGSTGWLHTDYLSPTQPKARVEASSALEPTTPAQPAYDRDQIVQEIIRASWAGYTGPCPCPYNRMRRGGECGRRSAYSKPGGYQPLCYANDVSDAMIAEFLRRR